MEAYLDNAATTNVTQEVYDAMKPYLVQQFGNPSSLHNIGIQNRKTINKSRKKVASLLGCNHKEVFFTSCGTESTNWALKGLATANPDKKEIITTSIEHHATLSTVEFLEELGYTVHILDVDKEGFIYLKQLRKLINDNTLVVSIIMANNEIGTIQNMKEIQEICEEKETYLHVDAVQVATHYPINLGELKADLVSFSGHKFHAPKGIGMLYVKEGINIHSLLHGGQQENKLRAGTENVAFIVGFTKALELGLKHMNTNNERLFDYSSFFLNELKKAKLDFILNGPEIGPNRLPGNINISFKDLDGSDITYYLNKENIYVSTGSACDSESINPSHVLRSINVPDDYIDATIRISIGDLTSFEELRYAINHIVKVVDELK